MSSRMTTKTVTTLRMMARSAWVVAVGVVLVTAAACDRGGSQPANPPPAPSTPPTPPTPDVTPKAEGGAGMSTTAGGVDAGAIGSALAKMPTTVPTQATQPSAAPALAPAALESAQRTKEAQDLVSRAMQAVKDGKLDDAKVSLDKIDAMGDAVPLTIRENATTVRRNLESARKIQTGGELPQVDPENK